MSSLEKDLKELAAARIRQHINRELRKVVFAGESQADIVTKVERVLQEQLRGVATGPIGVKVDGSRVDQGIIAATVMLPSRTTTTTVTVGHDMWWRVPGRFPSVKPPAWVERSRTSIPSPGTLVRAITGTRQWGIIGEREGKVGVFWSGDGWVGNYELGELLEMFNDCIEVM